MRNTEEKRKTINLGEGLNIIEPISKKMKNSIKELSLTREEAVQLCDAYENIVALRVACNNQIKAVERGCDDSIDENNALMWLYKTYEQMEKNLASLLDAYVNSSKIGRWMTSIKGIGPISAAYLMATLDITKVSHYNQFHSYCGLNDNNRPWLGRDKSSKIVTNILENKSEALDALRTVSSVLDEIDIIDFLDEYDDHHPKVEAIREIVLDKKEDDETKISNIKCILDMKGINSNVVGLSKKVNTKLKKRIPITPYHIIMISEATQWSQSYLYEYGMKDGKLNKDALIKACSKIPYNAELKRRCYLIADSFVKNHNKPDSLYGRLYDIRKAYETVKNENGDFKEQAKEKLATTNFSKKEIKAIYEAGKLSKKHIDNRARRYAVKIFIAHVFEAMYYFEYGEKSPVPYPMEYMGHVDYIEPEVPFIGFE